MSVGEVGSDLNAIDQEALGWVLLFERGPLLPEERRRFEAWVSQSSRHKGALIRARAASLRLNRLGAFAGGVSVVASPPSKSLSRRAWLAAAAAALVGIAALGGWLNRDWLDNVGSTVTYTSNVGELKTVTLADGSVVTLNTRTELRVHYTRAHRDIRLIRGEALFTVAHDPTRPFEVQAGDWSALAVGTAFSVRRLDKTTTDVTVTEGVVELLPDNRKSNDAKPRLVRDQEAIVGAGDIVELRQVSDSDVAKRLAWRTHLVVFTGEPLRVAVAEINRYSPRPIVIADARLAERQIVGVFSTVDPQTFISGMQQTLGVEAVEGEHSVLLR